VAVLTERVADIGFGSPFETLTVPAETGVTIGDTAAVSIAVLYVKFAVIVTREAFPPVSVMVVLAEFGFAIVASPESIVQLTKWLFVAGVARIGIAVAVFGGFAPVKPAVPFPLLLTVRLAVFFTKLAVIVTADACPPVRVTLVDIAAGFSIVAEPELTVQLTKRLFASAVAVIGIAVAVFTGLTVPGSVNLPLPLPILLKVSVAVFLAKLAVMFFTEVTFEMVSGFVVPE
jgi:hypothetical protein